MNTSPTEERQPLIGIESEKLLWVPRLVSGWGTERERRLEQTLRSSSDSFSVCRPSVRLLSSECGSRAAAAALGIKLPFAFYISHCRGRGGRRGRGQFNRRCPVFGPILGLILGALLGAFFGAKLGSSCNWEIYVGWANLQSNSGSLYGVVTLTLQIQNGGHHQRRL